ncbi:MAG: tripartite tricarboxylate transporter permease, partial [archaeon]
ILGTITGLSPGIHINTVSAIALYFSAAQSTELAIMIVAMTITHSFVDFIPSILLSAPDEETMLSILPGHHFLLKGKAIYAIKLTIAGGLVSAIAALAMLPLFALIVFRLGDFFGQIIPWILALSILLMVFSEKKHKKYAIITVAFSAALGLMALESNAVKDPLFPLAAGFFGASTIIYSMQKKESIPPQKEKGFKIKPKTAIKSTALSMIAAMAISFIPSLGPGQATFLLKQFFGKIPRTQYLLVMGGISTAGNIFAFMYLFMAQKARTGAAAAIKELAEPNAATIFLVACTMLISAGIAATTTDFLSKKAIKQVQRINYQKTNAAIFVLLMILVFAFSGFFGLLVFLTAAATGLIALSSGIKRSACMAFLMVPTILFYLQMAH